MSEEQEKLECYGCDCDIESGGELKGSDNEIYCEECFYDKFFTCPDCEEVELSEDSI